MSDWRRRLDGLEVERLAGGALALHQARTFTARRRGLAKLDALPGDVGLHIHRCGSVHTFGMRFGLDLIWLARDGRVLRVDRAVPPRRQRLCVRARSVVEVAAGGADRWVAGLGARHGHGGS